MNTTTASTTQRLSVPALGLGIIEVTGDDMIQQRYDYASCAMRWVKVADRDRQKVTAALAARDAAREDALAQARLGSRSWVRFGAIPESGRSYNNMDNTTEAGVSVYAAWVTDSKVWIDCTEGVAAMVALFSDLDLYLVTGTDTGLTGADGEPLLSDATAVAVLVQDWEVIA